MKSIKEHLIEHIKGLETDETLLDLKESIDYALSTFNRNEEFEPLLKLANFSLNLFEAIRKNYMELALNKKAPVL